MKEKKNCFVTYSPDEQKLLIKLQTAANNNF